MNTIAVLDTETNGFPKYGEPSDSPDQPHIVQLAAAIVDVDTREVVHGINFIVRPDGWEIPDDVAAIHGITQDKALEIGVPEEVAIGAFYALLADPAGGFRQRVAHNKNFDDRLIRIATTRYLSRELADEYREAESYCTMKHSQPICQLPLTEKQQARGIKGFKQPKLSEAYKHFTGNDLEGAHDAMVDVNACIAVYFGIQDHGKTAEPILQFS